VSARNEEYVGARCIVPKVNGNNTKTEKAQFIVPLYLNPNFFNAIRNTQYEINWQIGQLENWLIKIYAIR